MGENGAGKSTLMFILSGFLSPTKGSRSTLKKAAERRISAELNRLCGMIHQKPLLAGELSVFENIIMEKGETLLQPRDSLKREIRAVSRSVYKTAPGP